MNKLELVKKVLQNTEIKNWYETEHNLIISEMTHQSVRTYGTGNHGDIADLILNDGIENNIITQSDVDNI